MLRIVTITHYFPTHGGGIELVAGRLAQEFVRLGLRVDWFASDSDSPPPTRNPALNFHPVVSSNAIERLTQLPYPFWSLRQLPSLWRAIGSAHVVHVHEHIYFGSLIAILFARLRQRPLVITQHAGAVRFTSRWMTYAFMLANRVMGGVSLRLASHAVFISANVRRYFGLEKSAKALLIFNGVDTALFGCTPKSERESLRRALDIAPDRKVAIYVGRFVYKKGFPVLKELTNRFPDVLWLFAGAGPENPLDWKRDNVRVVGTLTHPELVKIYQLADMLVLPSFGEGMPLVVQEALACGVSVLSTQEVRDACPDASELINCPEAADNLAQVHDWEAAMANVLNDSGAPNAREMRAQRAKALWSWEICAASYSTVFRDAARARTSPREMPT